MTMFAARMLPMLAGIAIVAGLAGCENAVVVSGVDIAQGYSTDDLRRYGSGGNELRVDVVGDPFGDGANNTEVAVVNAMQGMTIGVPIAFAVEPKQEGSPPSRVVLFVNPRRLVGAESLCNPASPVTTNRSTDGKVRVSGAWCQSDFVMSSANARVADADSLASENFQAMIAQLTIAMFPAQSPHYRSGFRLCQPFC